jgi:hypothetical protein
MKRRNKNTIIYLAAVLAFLTGIGLTIAGFIVPPMGVISGSVLTALGEFLTFFGSVFGIGEFTRIKLTEIKRGKLEDDEDDNEND